MKLFAILLFLALAIDALAGTFPPFTASISLEDVQNASQRIQGVAGERIGGRLAGNHYYNSDAIPDIIVAANPYYLVIMGFTQNILRTETLYGTNGYIVTERPGYYALMSFVEACTTGDLDAITCVGPAMSNRGAYVISSYVINGGAVMPRLVTTNAINGTNGYMLVATPETPGAIAASARKFGIQTSSSIVTWGVHTNYERCLFVNYEARTNVVLVSSDSYDGTNGVSLVGGTAVSASIASGDVNGDGLGDIICADESGWGGTNGYIIFGKRRYCRELNLNTLTTNDGVAIAWPVSPLAPLDTADVNADGVDDIILRGGVILGRTTWPALLDGYSAIIGQPCDLGVIGDINGDGYPDLCGSIMTGGWPNPYIYFEHVSYGRPVLEYLDYYSFQYCNGTNGFTIKDDGALQTACRGGDWDKDGYEEAIFAWPFADPDGRTDAGEIYITHGGPSPAWSPYIFSPTLLLEGQSNVYYSDQLTNMVIGRKGKRHCVLNDAGPPVAQDWLGTWWTNMIVRSAASDTVTVRYWTTNVISVSNPATTLVITAIPEPCLLLLAMLLLCGLGTFNGERE